MEGAELFALNPDRRWFAVPGSGVQVTTKPWQPAPM